MKAVIFVDRIKPYGAERVAWSLAEGLAGYHDITVVTFSRQTPESHSAESFGYRKIGRSDKSYLVQAVTTVRDLRRLVRESQADVVISFMPMANMLACLALLGLPTKVVITEHTVPSGLNLVGFKKFVQWVLFSAFYRLADSIVCVSEAVRDDLATFTRIRASRIRRIYNPMDYERIEDESAEPLPAVPVVEGDDEVRLLMVGRFKPAKGHDLALRALSRLPERYSLYLVGDGELGAELKQLALELGVRDRVHFLGFRDNPYHWMRWADALLVPSRWEGFGLVLAEAAGVGIPVIASDVPALAEVARLTGATVVPQGSPEAISAACRGLSRKTRLRPVRVPEFRMDTVVSQYSSEIARVVSAR